jgi:hypothetical protein
LREGLDRIVKAKMGALVAVGDGPEVLNICSGGFLLDAEPLAAAEQVSRHFRTAWTAFAHSSDPGWSAYDATQRLVAVFGTELTVTPYPEERSRRLWAGHAFAALPLLDASIR